MATEDDVRRIAASLPETIVTVEESGRLAAAVRGKGVCWTWAERVHPRKARVPNPEVLAVRVSGEGDKQELIAADAAKFFTEPHYNGFPAVLVRLAAVDVEELTELLTDAWRVQAPRKLVSELVARSSRARTAPRPKG
jgi:hypothetical protein